MAEEYMREHPVCAYCASPIEPCLERASGWKHKIPWNPASGDLRCGGKAKPAEPPIPPTMTAEEREAQRRSFAYGNVTLHNPNVTRELIDKVADEIPPTSAPKHDGSEHFYAENFGMSVSTPAPEPQEEIPEDLVRWYEDAKVPHAAWGASSVRSLIERIGRAESALRAAREERHICPECDRPQSLLSNGPVEYKYVCEFCGLIAENEKLDAALKAAQEERDMLKAAIATPEVYVGVISEIVEKDFAALLKAERKAREQAEDTLRLARGANIILAHDPTRSDYARREYQTIADAIDAALFKPSGEPIR